MNKMNGYYQQEMFNLSHTHTHTPLPTHKDRHTHTHTQSLVCHKG